MSKIDKVLLNHLLDSLHILYLPSALANNTKITKKGIISAETNNKNIESLGYIISKNSYEDFLKFMSIDPGCNIYDVINGLQPQPNAHPMYPDFPQQVIDMCELEYRVHQYLHYCSTYGVENICSLLGINGYVEKGWMPHVDNTIKTKNDISLIDATPIDIVCSKKELDNIIFKQLLSKKERLKLYDLALIDLIDDDSIIFCNKFTYQNIKFHENLYPILDKVLFSSLNSNVKSEIIFNMTQHIVDIFKYIIYVRSNKPTNWRFTTSQKKALCKALIKHYDNNKQSFITNIEDNRKLAKTALALISFIKYYKNKIDIDLQVQLYMLLNNKLKNWTTKKEIAYKNGDFACLLELYRQRPGILVRELKRLIKTFYSFTNIDINRIEFLQTLKEMPYHKMSLETLLNVVNESSIWEEKNKYDNDNEEIIEEEPTFNNIIKYDFLIVLKHWITSMLEDKFSKCDYLPKNCKVLLDTNNFDLNSSYLSSNKSDVATYYKSGMSVKIPNKCKILRFFVFWNDTSKRVDLDLHCTTNNGIHVGWCSDYNMSGITLSGDITHSTNACEYIDINLAEANNNDIDCINASLECFTKEKFCDIETAFCGLLAVNNTDVDTKLYNSKNVLNKVDLTQSYQTALNLVQINLSKNTITYLMTPRNYQTINNTNCEKLQFSVQDYLNLLAKTNNLEFINIKDITNRDNYKNCPIISIGKSTDDKSISLIDNNWFL